jgi:hypothetical protein
MSIRKRTDYMRLYELNDFQNNMKANIKSLPIKHLHYVTAQQSNKYSNLTLKELKKLIRKGIRQYIQQIEPSYSKGCENALVKFYCVFETKKSFSLSQHLNNLHFDDPKMGLHFHLFLSCPDSYNWISFDSLIFHIFDSLTSIPHKKSCLSEYGYFKIDELKDDFLNYHTKQFVKVPSSEMIYSNLS